MSVKPADSGSSKPAETKKSPAPKANDAPAKEAPARTESSSEDRSDLSSGARSAEANHRLGEAWSSADAASPLQDTPDSVDRVVDVDAFLDEVEVPAEVSAEGADAVNQYKIDALTQELHSHIYEPTGEVDAEGRPEYAYREDAPFTDADAVKTIYEASADLTLETTLAEHPRPPAFDNDRQWMETPEMAREWKDRFVGLTSRTLAFDSDPGGRFGDYGWHPNYQDGTQNQSSHFHAAFSLTYGVTADPDKLEAVPGGSVLGPGTVAYGGNIIHEWWPGDKDPQGGSTQDFMNSQMGIDLGTRLAEDPSFTPFDFADEWHHNTVTGAPYQDVDPGAVWQSLPSHPELAPAVLVPERPVEREYPGLCYAN